MIRVKARTNTATPERCISSVDHCIRALCPAPYPKGRKHCGLVPPAKQSPRRRRWEVEHHRVPPAKNTPPVDHSDGVGPCNASFTENRISEPFFTAHHNTPPIVSPAHR
ncbi:unnamed protein product [Brassica napus]|uniref:(rape) hypothetical protein n=1 Tax=Brassica napus TaxID=3708 RepID=A0A817BC82_BRANA|nr:unnamed protein product [Brassica napus]